ncbi:sporulation integral membrane protein YlbJ [Pseudobacteroides cellulosolvens]|uniref:Sporulation integral membrane protein YlbJ n=1 Tax=Pseudobacteroides cellulosolvens ATCC 35603 = DSM 2933 TaxID=398512 RepID=A0A0L6JKI1_9FIRM|nr:sporulation integral membrane protein YlbJ [Pseudobacteroides cellulosolvens]KNY26260.1 sporulation integral membrane protein YlbJ [Pseudobacteroides cellulosolvens ATCC 35603 = DSM 2933]
MTTIIFIITVLLFILLLFYKPIRIKYTKPLALPLFCIIFILAIVIYPKTSVSSALKGINICLNIVFPSLFPFLAASELLNRTSFIKAAGILLEPIMRPLFNVPGCGSFAVAMGITSGYPVGAKITVDLRNSGQISKLEGERLLAFTNNSGPLFIVGAVATGMYAMPRLGFFLLLCHILSGITVGLLFKYYSFGEIKSAKYYQKSTNKKSMNLKNNLDRFKTELFKNKNSHGSLGILFGDAIRNSVMILLSIGGFITFFSVLINLLIETGIINIVSIPLTYILSFVGLTKEAVYSLVCGFFEITTGSNMMANTENIPFSLKLALSSMIIGWAGLSVHSQVLGIVSQSDLSIKPYLAGKSLHGLIAAIYTFIIYKLAGSFLNFENEVIASFERILQLNWLDSFLYSFRTMICVIICIIFISSLLKLLHFIYTLRKET